LAAIKGEGSNRATLEAGLLSAQMCLLARESCRSQQFQDIVPLGPLEQLTRNNLIEKEAS
jgi:hypothetical protein